MATQILFLTFIVTALSAYLISFMFGIRGSKESLKTGLSPFYTFAVQDAKHQPYDLNQLKGKVVVVVNVASKCGFTPQYQGLEALYKKYKDRGVEIIGFPCNQFGSQEPGTESEIVQFCSLNYGVSFPIMSKVEVNGNNAHPLWEWMKKEKTQLGMSVVKWNFEKFLINKDGWVHGRYASTFSPSSLEKPIEELLAAAPSTQQ